jgi:hypothetical protein
MISKLINNRNNYTLGKINKEKEDIQSALDKAMGEGILPTYVGPSLASLTTIAFLTHTPLLIH